MRLTVPSDGEQEEDNEARFRHPRQDLVLMWERSSGIHSPFTRSLKPRIVFHVSGRYTRIRKSICTWLPRGPFPPALFAQRALGRSSMRLLMTDALHDSPEATHREAPSFKDVEVLLPANPRENPAITFAPTSHFRTCSAQNLFNEPAFITLSTSGFPTGDVYPSPNTPRRSHSDDGHSSRSYQQARKFPCSAYLDRVLSVFV